MSLQQSLFDIRRRIEAACARSGRSASDVELIAVTKYVSIDTTREVLDLGLQHIGENRWQDAEAKWHTLGKRGTWHFIGHLQSNKVKDVLGKFAYIHSLDRLSLAREIEKKAAQLRLEVPCFVQVNVSGEQTKHGLAVGEFAPFMEQLQSFPHIKPVGLMTMAPHEEDPERTRPVFRKLRELRDAWNAANPDRTIAHLSMGMSNDFEIAVEEGATWIRLGSVLVGNE